MADPVTVGGVCTVLGGLVGYLTRRRQNDTDDKKVLTESQRVLTEHQNQLFSTILELQRENKELHKVVDVLQDEVRKLKTALDKRDARIAELEKVNGR